MPSDRATISSGTFSLSSGAERADQKDRSTGQKKGASDACHILILADFSGRDHRGLNDMANLSKRKIIEVDRDNFDEVFEQLDVRCALPISDEEMRFSELDEMHPDFIYDQVPMFNRFRALKKKLKSPSTFSSAAEEIYGWHTESQGQAKTEEVLQSGDSSNAENGPGGSLLDNILSGTDSTSLPDNSFDVQALVKDIVAPFVTPKPDPQQKELIASVDEAASKLMREIMHHPQFQTIESAWRSLYLLVKRVETDRNLKIFIADVSHQEILDDTADNESLEQSSLHKLIVQSRSAVGGTPFSVIMADFVCQADLDQITAFGRLGEIALASDAYLLAGASEQIAGCERLDLTPDKEDWSFELSPELNECWEALRSKSHAANMIAIAPRYLSRMPYGRKTAPIESFDFEELPKDNRHAYYLWSNGAWLVALTMAQSFTIGKDVAVQHVQEVDRLPLHVFEDDDESKVTPCAEIHMLDPASQSLGEQGLTVLRSILNKDSLMIPEIRVLLKDTIQQ